jgi:cell division ATPase FtsA
MRKGVVVNLQGPAQAMDDALGEAERMSGYQVNAATMSVNGAHILSTHADGMVAVGAAIGGVLVTFVGVRWVLSMVRRG